jgi:hypothetical protein
MTFPDTSPYRGVTLTAHTTIPLRHRNQDLGLRRGAGPRHLLPCSIPFEWSLWRSILDFVRCLCSTIGLYRMVWAQAPMWTHERFIQISPGWRRATTLLLCLQWCLIDQWMMCSNVRECSENLRVHCLIWGEVLHLQTDTMAVRRPNYYA